MRARQLRTVDRESADDRLTSATEKTTPALSEYSTIESPDGRLERLQRRSYARVRLNTVHVFSSVKRKICSFTVEVGRRSFACDK